MCCRSVGLWTGVSVMCCPSVGPTVAARPDFSIPLIYGTTARSKEVLCLLYCVCPAPVRTKPIGCSNPHPEVCFGDTDASSNVVGPARPAQASTVQEHADRTASFSVPNRWPVLPGPAEVLIGAEHATSFEALPVIDAGDMLLLLD
jgi:hypothetical protein